MRYRRFMNSGSRSGLSCAVVGAGESEGCLSVCGSGSRVSESECASGAGRIDAVSAVIGRSIACGECRNLLATMKKKDGAGRRYCRSIV